MSINFSERTHTTLKMVTLNDRVNKLLGYNLSNLHIDRQLISHHISNMADEEMGGVYFTVSSSCKSQVLTPQL